MTGKRVDLRNDDVTVFEIEYGFKSIWEVSRTYRCPLIGLCLNEDEHKRILKKAGFQVKGMKLYEIHSLIMQQLNDESKIAIKVDNYLNRKYRDVLLELGNVTESELLNEWNKRLECGEFDGLFYLACTRRDFSQDLVDEMFGEIHMMSHAGINSISKVKSELRESINSNKKLKDHFKEQKQHYRELKKDNQFIQNLLNSTQKELELAHNTTPSTIQVDEHPSEVLEPDLKTAELQKENEKLRMELRATHKKVSSLTELLKENLALTDHLKEDMEELISHFAQLAKTPTNSDSIPPGEQDLESKRVLIVGGMTKIKHLYQHMIEMNGGQFEYHDGYLKNGHQNLDAKVLRSDIIICPVNCNSHNACNRIKRLCRKYKKPLKMLPNASVSSISTALFTGEANLNAQHL